MKVHDVSGGGEAPTQFEGETDQNRPVYIRYRGGCLSVEVGPPHAYDASPGYTVLEMEVDSACGFDGSITWDEVEKIIAPIDLAAALSKFEDQERRYKARWAALLSDLQTRDVAGVSLHTLRITEIPWVTPYDDRVGRFEFEKYLVDRLDPGIFAYVHAEGQMGFFRQKRYHCITIVTCGKAIHGLKPLDLLQQKAQRLLAASDLDPQAVWAEETPTAPAWATLKKRLR